MQITEESSVTFTPGPASRYQWVAAGPHPCPKCAELNGEVRTLETWNSSINPGFHKHCQCYLQVVDLVDSGMAFTNQFCHIGIADILNAISIMFRMPEAEGCGSHHSYDEAEGASDVVPYHRDTSTTEYDNGDGGDQYSNRGV